MTKQDVMEWLDQPQTEALFKFLQRELEDLEDTEFYQYGDPFKTMDGAARRAAAMQQVQAFIDLKKPTNNDLKEIWGIDEQVRD